MLLCFLFYLANADRTVVGLEALISVSNIPQHNKQSKIKCGHSSCAIIDVVQNGGGGGGATVTVEAETGSRFDFDLIK